MHPTKSTLCFFLVRAILIHPTMRSSWSSIAALLAAAVAVSAATFPIPDLDPFYQAPAGFASKAPGTVLKSRASTSGSTGVTAQQILYRTTGGKSYLKTGNMSTNEFHPANGEAIATVATILRGANSSSTKLLSVQTAEDSVNSTCSPSYSYSSGQGGP